MRTADYITDLNRHIGKLTDKNADLHAENARLKSAILAHREAVWGSLPVIPTVAPEGEDAKLYAVLGEG